MRTIEKLLDLRKSLKSVRLRTDHRPIWLEIDIDGSDQFLTKKLESFKRLAVPA